VLFQAQMEMVWLMVVCVLISGGTISYVVQPWFAGEKLPPIVIRQPTTPL
jgi:L-ascorbate metabolism protein UlaG (beta-lactamase superfamily)